MDKEKNVQNETLYKRVIADMEVDEIYRDSSLTVEKVAQQFNVSNRYLSGLIHTFAQMNFNSFVNQFRIEKAKQLMARPEFDNYTLEAIGREVGFNSKTSYIHAFKIFTGVTPSVFKKEFSGVVYNEDEKKPYCESMA